MDFRFGAMGSKVYIFSWPNRCAAAQRATATDTNSSGALCHGPLGLGRLEGEASRRAKRECVPRPLIRPSSERPTRRCGLRRLPGSLPDPLLAVTPVGDMVKLQAALLGHPLKKGVSSRVAWLALRRSIRSTTAISPGGTSKRGCPPWSGRFHFRVQRKKRRRLVGASSGPLPTCGCH